MSGNQSRFDKSEYRKPNRSSNSSGTYQRSYVNKNSAGSSGGCDPPHPPSNRSFKKTNNVKGGQSAINLQPTVAAPSQTQHNGITSQPMVHGSAVTAVSEILSRAHESSSSQNSSRAVPKAPSSQSAAMSSSAKLPTTPVKEEVLKPIAVQSGSISPGFMNGMQIPARTSSPPPNLDEQKRNQARLDSLRAIPTAPVPAVPKQQLPEKEAGVSKHVHGVDPHSVSRVKKEPQVSPASSSPQKPPTIPVGGIPTQLVKMMPGNSVTEDSNVRKTGSQNKGEPDDWEDAADVATPEAGALDNGEPHEELIQNDSQSFRDFLLKFQSQNYSLPEGISIAPNVTSVLLTPSANKDHLDRNSNPSPGKHAEGSRLDRHGAATNDDKWNKVQGHVAHNRDSVNSAGGFRYVQGGNSSVLRNAREAPGQFLGVNHSGPPHSINAMHRNNTEADRWLRGSNFQKGLIPSPQTSSQMMHKAEKRYELGKAADEEQAKPRKLKALLNKLTPQNFEKLFKQVNDVNINSVVTLAGLISQIFDKALMEPTLYADFCCLLSGELPEFNEENEKITFKRVLLNKCQEEFEKGEREQEEANQLEDSEIAQTKEEREERRVLARRRMLGNIRFIGELFKKKMLTERIMHECIKKLLGRSQNSDEQDLEALCKLMSTIGEMIDHPKAKPFMDAYFDMMGKLSDDMSLPSRVRFMLKDAIDLRRNNWQQRRKIEGPKKIDEVHRDAAQERQAQANRLARGPGTNASGRRGPPPEFGSRGSNNMPSPNSHSSNFRGYPSHSRGMGNQDIRSQDRHSSSESRTLSVPLRTVRDDSITLGPQGGLARGMSSRGSTSFPSAPQRDRPLKLWRIKENKLGLGVRDFLLHGANVSGEQSTLNCRLDSPYECG